MNIFALVFLFASYLGSLIYKDTTHILLGIGFVIIWYLSDIIKELKKK